MLLFGFDLRIVKVIYCRNPAECKRWAWSYRESQNLPNFDTFIRFSERVIFFARQNRFDIYLLKPNIFSFHITIIKS